MLLREAFEVNAGNSGIRHGLREESNKAEVAATSLVYLHFYTNNQYVSRTLCVPGTLPNFHVETCNGNPMRQVLLVSPFYRLGKLKRIRNISKATSLVNDRIRIWTQASCVALKFSPGLITLVVTVIFWNKFFFRLIFQVTFNIFSSCHLPTGSSSYLYQDSLLPAVKSRLPYISHSVSYFSDLYPVPLE